MQSNAKPNCYLINASTAPFCSKWGYPVTEDAKLDTESAGDTIRQHLREKPAAQNAIMGVFKELKNNYLIYCEIVFNRK